MNKKKIAVITGALGQDGIILSKILLKRQFLVYGLIKNHNNKKKIKDVIYNKIELQNYQKVKKYLDKINPNCFIHLGTENPSYREINQKDFYKINLKNTKNLIKYFSENTNRNKLILIGSSQMFDTKNKIVKDTSKFSSSNSYSKFRIHSFKIMKSFKKKFNSNIVMAILFNHDSIYRKKKFLLPRLISMVKYKKYKMIDDIFQDNISGDFSHAEDICEGIYRLILLKKNIDKIILSSNKRIYINNIINYLLKINKDKKKFFIRKKKNISSPIGVNSYTKKILKWKIKKNIFMAAKELFYFNEKSFYKTKIKQI